MIRGDGRVGVPPAIMASSLDGPVVAAGRSTGRSPAGPRTAGIAPNAGRPAAAGGRGRSPRRRWSPARARAASARSGRPAPSERRRLWSAPASTHGARLRPDDDSGGRGRQRRRSLAAATTAASATAPIQPTIAGKDIAGLFPCLRYRQCGHRASAFARCASLMRISGRAWKSLATSNGA